MINFICYATSKRYTQIANKVNQENLPSLTTSRSAKNNSHVGEFVFVVAVGGGAATNQ